MAEKYQQHPNNHGESVCVVETLAVICTPVEDDQGGGGMFPGVIFTRNRMVMSDWLYVIGFYDILQKS